MCHPLNRAGAASSDVELVGAPKEHLPIEITVGRMQLLTRLIIAAGNETHSGKTTTKWFGVVGRLLMFQIHQDAMARVGLLSEEDT